ncbi:GlsB/YeaQ/YmgE family stress response membrane protein [Taylorella equigenitalis]|uniref:GlsB/YeaQ/YmgE family stress response membrane protein n=1 Tax=Taylorella equigenitalis TaxID=29575 RepID=UPI0004141FBD|nr:GlsB/YeaQ/YmgE family stress response membrane protein [Taylorella equigenitalis]WDU47915.1 GlsB/YeaQ/YmgE family stress response membrane protein [Taylorella equigenitalis]
MSILWTILIGFVVGIIAKAIMPGNQGLGFVLTTLLGIAGSIVGVYAGQALGLYHVGEPAGFIGSVIGALLILFVLGLVTKRS